MTVSPASVGIARPPWLSILGVLFMLGGLLALGLLLVIDAAVANDTRYPEGVGRLLLGASLLLGTAGWLGLAAGRGLMRGYRSSFWLASLLIWGFPAALVAVGRGGWGEVGLLLVLAVWAQAFLLRARRQSLLLPAPPGERWLLLRRAVFMGAAIYAFGWFALSMGVAHVGRIEGGVLADLRSFCSAEEAYRQSNGGLYESRIECLGDPGRCLGQTPGSEPPTPFLDEETTRRLTIRDPSYYRYRLGTADRAGHTDEKRSLARSPTSVGRYAMSVGPLQPGRALSRSFCVDWSGRLCFNRDGHELPVREGSCPPPPECEDLS
jgi:hypothetical protein